MKKLRALCFKNIQYCFKSVTTALIFIMVIYDPEEDWRMEGLHETLIKVKKQCLMIIFQKVIHDLCISEVTMDLEMFPLHISRVHYSLCQI
jgi:hypothetical protein